MKKHPDQDRNFNGLAPRFKRNIYNTMKGRLRLEVLKRDFSLFVFDDEATSKQNVLDVGAGQGYWAIEMLKRGYKVDLNDVSDEMLSFAQAHIASSALSGEEQASTRFLSGSFQQLPLVNSHYDIICCHAILEWLNQPEDAIAQLVPHLKVGGWFSIIFYNVHGLVFKNLLRSNFKKVLASDFKGTRGSLTPLNPLQPDQVDSWCVNAGLNVVCKSGIRVFHDYILNPEDRNRNLDQQLELELQFSNHPAYQNLGRYIHILGQKQ